MNLRHLMRLARMARHPPSPKMVKVVLAVVGVVALAWGVEVLIGWPEWLTPRNNFSRRGGI